jgi:hypothetical protein
MEDVEFSQRLRTRCAITLLDPAIISSPRKHLAQGPWRVTLKNASLLALFALGVSPDRLHALYYKDRKAAGKHAIERRAAQPAPESSPL